MAESVADALIGRTIADKYKIEALLGRGGMGSVYRAKQTSLKRSVAVKVLHPTRLGDLTFASRFKREAKTMSMFEHPNALRILDFGQEADGLLYLVTEFIDGRDLLRVMREDWPLLDARIVGILAQVLAALARAHEEGILHRDLKPENIMVFRGKDDDGEPAELVKVCDFGIAKVQERRADGDNPEEGNTQTGTLTAHGMLVGTPEYISPEQVKNEVVDARSDLYAVGVMLYQMLTGRLPFEATTAIRLVMMQVEQQPRRPSTHHPRVNPRLEAICMKALQKKPDDRFASARELRAALRAAVAARTTLPPARIATLPPEARAHATDPPGREITRRMRRERGVGPASAASAALRADLALMLKIVLATAVICAALLYFAR